MLFERIISKGLSHYSYLIGDKNDAAVIDPRRDCDIYIEKASAEGMRISHILETHRNEDYFAGSMELAEKTGAKIWHADGQLDYQYGEAVKEGLIWKVGRLEIQSLQTPGHTQGSMSYLLRDPDKNLFAVFTGDAIFAGEVGRIDLMGEEKAYEMANLLYESIFDKLMTLGDDILVCPAHGSGSVCGESIAERLWTTIGLEKKHNLRLKQTEKHSFINALLSLQQEKPPYFSKMEEVNLTGKPVLRTLHLPIPLAPSDFETLSKDCQMLDTRMEVGFGAAHIPGALSIWIDGLASFAGWFLSYDKPLLLIVENNDIVEATITLMRLGFDKIPGYLAGSMLNWHMSGRKSSAIPTLNVQDFCQLLDKDETPWILDVRNKDELMRDGTIRGSHHIHVTQIPKHFAQIPKNEKIFIFCGSGMRSMIVASLLKAHGWNDITVVLGGMAGWKSRKCPVVK